MTRVECHEHQLRVGHLQDHVDFGLALDDRPRVRVERELDAVLERALADLVEIFREDLAVRAAEVLRPGAPAEVGLERRDAEVRRELGVGAVAVERGLQLGRVEIFSAARDRRDADPGLVEHFLEDLGRLRQVLLQLIAPRFDSMEAKLRGHLMPSSGCGFIGVNMWLLIAQRNLSPGSACRRSPQRDTDGGTETRADEVATTQHTKPRFGKDRSVYGDGDRGECALEDREVKASRQRSRPRGLNLQRMPAASRWTAGLRTC